MSKLKKEYRLIIIAILVLIIVDQLIKIVAINNDGVYIIDGVLRCKIFENVNGAYMDGNNSTVMYVLTNIVVVAVAFQFITSQNQFVDNKIKVFLSLIIAGGISNTIDRVFRGFSVGFLDFNDVFKFPVFGIADIYIIVGWVCMAAVFAVFTANELKEKKRR